MKARLLSLLLFLFGTSVLAQVPTPSASTKLTTATCGKPVCTWNAFGPITYTRNTGQPQTVSNNFSVLNPNTQFTLHIDNSGVTSAVISVNGTQIFGPSDFNSNVTSLDRAVTLAAGNTVQVQLRGKLGTSLAVTVIGVDNDPPSITETETPSPNSFGWNNTNVNVSFACIDATSGVAPCPASQVLSSEGLNQLVAGTAFDLAGNSATASVQISIDKTPPTILPSQNPPPNSFGWNNSPATVGFLCNDNLSGVQACTPPVLLSNQGQNQSVIGMATDFAGNSATASTAVSIDLTPPTIVATSSPAPNSSGWNNTAVTVNFSCTDDLSGVASCPIGESISSEGANQSISGTAFDKAGNSSSASVSLNIDETPPTISISSPTTGSTVVSASLQITGTVSDNLSGVALVRCNGTAAVVSTGTFSCNVSLIAGANIISVQAADKAGNTASSQITVTFNATPPPPPKSLLITPSLVNMLIGDVHSVALIGDIGQMVSAATWSISDPTIVSITSADPPQLTALAQGTATLTATFNGLTTTMTINVLPGLALPPATPLWAFDPLPGNTITEMVPGNPVNPGDPDLYAVESPDTLRGFTKDGLQLWALSPGAASSTAASFSALSAIQQQKTATNVPAFSLAAIPASAQELLRRHGAFDSLDLLMRQQRLIEQHQRLPSRPSPATAAFQATPFSSSSALENDATAGSTTLLIKTVPDNSGGTINLVETFTGCCQITQSSLIKIDNTSQQQVWRDDFPGPIDENFAIGDDNTIYSSQIIFTGTTDLFFGSSSNSRIFALDGATGRQKFSLPLPPGHISVTVTNSRFSPPSAVVADLDVAAQPGPLSILPDGSINAVVYTNHLTETFNSFILAPSNETAVSDHKTLQLLTIQPDGSFATQPIQAFDFDVSGCAAGCKDPGAGYVPNEVVPDGEGGSLATWTGNDTQLGITSSSAALVRHFDNAGGTLDYVVPFASSSWFRVGGDNPQALVVGENGTAFASDGQSVIAFDVNTGAPHWTFQPGGFQGTALLAATAQGGVAAAQLADFQGEIDATPNALLSFDSAGAAIATPFLGGNSGLSYFDSNTLLAVAGAGQGEMLSASAAFDPNAFWWNKGDPPAHRKAPTPQITKVTNNRALVGSSANLSVQGTAFGKSPQLIFGDPSNPRTDLTISNFQYNKAKGIITAIINVAFNAADGKVFIFVKSGNSISKSNKNAFFFVQIPKQLQMVSEGVSTIVPLATANGCPTTFVDEENPGPYGIKLVIKYQVLDQDNPAKSITAAMPLREDLLNLVADGQLIGSKTNQLVTASGSTESDGTFVDQPVGACAGVPFIIATFTQRLFIPLSPQLSPTVRSNNFSQTGRKGCGVSTNHDDIKIEVPCN